MDISSYSDYPAEAFAMARSSSPDEAEGRQAAANSSARAGWRGLILLASALLRAARSHPDEPPHTA